MQMNISNMSLADLEAVDKLMKLNSRTLGFLPKEALCEYIERGGVLGAKTCENELAGYLLFAAYSEYIRIGHLCVSENFRDQGVARALLDRLKDVATTQKTIRLRCRRDFPANEMWPRFGFVALDERPGRSFDGDPLTLWYLMLAQDDQIGLFQAKVSDERFDVIIDAQVFFDLEEPIGEKTIPSKSLTSDFLTDLVRLRITDEMFNEINRQEDDAIRSRSRNRAHIFSQANTDPILVEKYDALLRENVLQVNKPSDESDVRQLAKAAASDIDFFITRDSRLLAQSEDILRLTHLEVLSPTALILRLHERSEGRSYLPTNVSGIGLHWRRLTSDELLSAEFEPFLIQGERKGSFRAKLESLVAADPKNCRCEVLRSGGAPLALRVICIDSDHLLEVRLSRVARSSRQGLIEQFVVADTLAMAVREELYAVEFTPEAVLAGTEAYMSDLGFVHRHDGGVTRFCLPRCFDSKETLAFIARRYPGLERGFRDIPVSDLERCCSPLCLQDVEQSYFLIPIRPGYALSLVDRNRASTDLFGGEPSVLLRWDNVYYRTKDRHHMLQAPGRILWYVSGDRREVVAVSHLDDVEVGAGRSLFKRFAKFGILDWRAIYSMCNGDPDMEIMALRFSHTFSFRRPVSLAGLRIAYSAEGQSLVLQSPSRLSAPLFMEIFQRGFPERL